MKFKPLFGRLIVKRHEKTLVTPGGLLLNDATTAVSQDATVIAVGPGPYLEDGSHRPLPIKVGDKIMIGRGAGLDMTIEGEEVTILDESNVIGVY